jgi:hypothetical protein
VITAFLPGSSRWSWWSLSFLRGNPRRRWAGRHVPVCQFGGRAFLPLFRRRRERCLRSSIPAILASALCCSLYPLSMLLFPPSTTLTRSLLPPGTAPYFVTPKKRTLGQWSLTLHSPPFFAGEKRGNRRRSQRTVPKRAILEAGTQNPSGGPNLRETHCLAEMFNHAMPSSG